MDALFGFVAPIAASKNNVKLAALHAIFRKINIRIKHGFSCNNIRHVPGEMFRAKGRQI